MNRYCLALDLKDDPKLIEEYENHHQKIWPEIKRSISSSGIEVMEIYRTGNRLFMIMETHDNFSFDNKAARDAANATVQEWEALMGTYQQALPQSKPGERWVLMKNIFKL